MTEKNVYPLGAKPLSQDEVYRQLKDIEAKLKEVHEGVSGIIQDGGMPDSAKHLDEVLRHTEEAATDIMNAASAIGDLVSGSPDTIRDKVGEHVTKIFEACTFQDISGQRIKKVLKSLKAIEDKVSHLVHALEGKKGNFSGSPHSKGDPLLSGPQLPSDAPTQEEVDKLFSKLNNG